ncbi:FAD-binding oxidoreductase [Actinomadura fibrosa]|uniref:FAD-binding oxidoreductase n=1 Tax=Actinomadura fibrosa TaxID=111802 RepID=A0ABW2XM39_9ACTN|nr:FAD-binding oxidoreductase [Actinomadura fibrosa]
MGMTFTGTLHLPGDDGFAEAVSGRLFNARRPAHRRPAAVLEAATEQDVVDGVRLAIERGWKVAVRSGGHSWASWSVRDDALLIDLGRFREMRYDAATGTVTATPSIKGGDELNPYLARFGRFFNGGHCPSVGIGGFLLQGGQGWNARGWGWAAESIAAIDLVTAEGELVRADETQNADLFWAARGAGPGFFGAVTRFHLRTRPLPKAMAFTVHAYPLSLFDQVMTWLHGMHHTVSPLVEIVAVTQTPDEPLPGHTGGEVLLVTGVAMTDTLDEGRRALAPLHANPYADRALLRVEAEPTSLGEQIAKQRVANPEGHRYLVDNAWLRGAPDQVVPAMRRAFTTHPTERSFTIWFSMAPLRELPDMAFSLQSEIYSATYVVYDDASRDEELAEWLRRAMADMEAVTAGQYLGDSDFTERRLKFMGDRQWARLRRIRAERDPKGLFAGYLVDDDGLLNINHWEL